MMLEESLKKKIKEALSSLKENVIIEISESNNKEFNSLLKNLSQINSKIIIKKNLSSSIPLLQIKKFKFYGVPLGHELSTLILAILNSQKLGKLPDKEIIKRIKNLPEINFESYISLDCSICPDIVQNLNLISFFNNKITHSVKDGFFFEKDLINKNIKGVPSIFINNKLFFSGKLSLSDILDKLENYFKIQKQESNLGNYDVAIIGGGPAGVSSAIYTARKGLKTCIIAESIGGQINDTKGIENLISNSYIEGKSLSKNLRDHLNQYDIDIFENRKVKYLSDKIELSSKELVKYKALIIATGAKWKKLNIKGEDKFLGSGVHFCPNCDGMFYQNKDVIVVGGGNSGLEAAIDLSNIVNSVTILEYQNKIIADDVLLKKVKNLKNIKIILNAEIQEIKGDQELSSILYKERNTNKIKKLKTNGVFVQIGLSPNTQFLNNIDLNEKKEIIIDKNNKTNINNIFAAGDVTNIPYKQIIISMGEGAKAGLSVFEYLMIKSAD